MKVVENNFQKMFNYFVKRSDYDKQPIERPVATL